MKKNIITAPTFAKRNPAIAILASLFLPGLGHAYCGEWARGFLFPSAISLFALLMPFGLIIHPGLPSLPHVISIGMLGIAAYIMCPIDAVRISLKKNTQGSAHPVRLLYMIAFSLFSSLTISTSLRVIPTVYSIENATHDAMEPSFFIDEKLLVASPSTATLQPGDAVVFMHNGITRIGRIIARGNDHINSKDGMMEVNGIPLSIGIILADEIHFRDLPTEEDLFYEVTGTRKYSVHLTPARGRIRFTGTPASIPIGQYAIAFDNRLREKSHLLIQASSIVGRIEGVFVGKTWRRFFLPPYDRI